MSKKFSVERIKELPQTLIKRFQFENLEMALKTILFSLIGVLIYILLAVIPMPYKMVSVFKFGLAPAFAVIAVAGAIRGPIAGLLVGYLGTLIRDFIIYSTILNFTLPNLAFGLMGFIVGMAKYKIPEDRTLIKMSAMSVLGAFPAVLLVGIIAISVEGIEMIVGIGFVMLPLLTVVVPSVLLITPLLAWFWHFSIYIMLPKAFVVR